MTMFFKSALFLQASALILGLVVVALAASAALMGLSSTRSLEKKLQDHGMALAENGAYAVSNFEATSDAGMLQAFVLQLIRSDGVPGAAMVCDRVGTVLSHSQEELKETTLLDLSPPPEAASASRAQRQDGSAILKVTAPIFKHGDLWGSFRVEVSLALVQAEMSHIVGSALWLGGGLLTLGILAAFWLYRVVAAPIRKLTRAAHEAARGNFTARIDIECRDEVGEAVLAFEALSKTVRESRTQVTTLEQKVATRTQAFEAKKNELLEAKKAAEAARGLADGGNRAKSEFLAAISQEIRSPVTSILGRVDLALGTQLLPEQRSYITLVKESAQGLLVILNDLREVSKLGLPRRDLLPIDFSLRELAGDTLKLLATRAHEKGLELVCGIDSNVPDALVGDPDRVRQVLLNLTGTAIKCTSAGDVILRIRQQTLAPSEVRLQFSVSDTGDGAQSRSAASSQAISVQLAAMMDGKVWVEKDGEKGATVHFDARFGLQPEPSPGPAALESGVLKDLSVLVVADSTASRQVMSEILSSWSMKPELVDCADGAVSALDHAAAAGCPFDFMILDGGVVEIEALQLARKASEHPGLGGSIVTLRRSLEAEEGEARWKEAGVARVLMKPIKESELLSALFGSLTTSRMTVAWGHATGDLFSAPFRLSGSPGGVEHDRPLLAAAGGH